MNTILITGSSGLIGSAAVQRFQDQFRVIGLDTKAPKTLQHSNFEHIDINLGSNENVDAVLDLIHQKIGGELAAVIHLAAYYDFTGKDDPNYEEITVRGTERLINALKNFSSVGRFIFGSTMLVHAPTEPGAPINESSPIAPGWPYPRSKAAAEEILIKQHGKIPIAILRIAGVYNDTGNSISLTHQIHHIYERMPVSHFFPGNRSHGQAFVHLDDVVDAFSLAVEKRSSLPPEFIALIGESATANFGELQDEIAELLYKDDWTTYRIPKALAELGAVIRNILPFRKEPLIQPKVIPFADDHYELDVSRARNELGWAPQHFVLNVLPKIIGALQADAPGWYSENQIEPPSWLERKRAA